MLNTTSSIEVIIFFNIKAFLVSHKLQIETITISRKMIKYRTQVEVVISSKSNQVNTFFQTFLLKQQSKNKWEFNSISTKQEAQTKSWLEWISHFLASCSLVGIISNKTLQENILILEWDFRAQNLFQCLYHFVFKYLLLSRDIQLGITVVYWKTTIHAISPPKRTNSFDRWRDIF